MRISFVKLLSILLILFSASCNSQIKDSSANEEIKRKASLLQDAVLFTYKSGDSTKLYTAYQLLVKENGFDKCVINPYYIRNVITILTLLKKYEKLDCILRNEKNNIDQEFREDLIDANEYSQYKDQNYSRAIEAINRTIKRYENKIVANPKDSLTEQKLFLTKVYIIGKNAMLKQIDSIANLPLAKYSSNYYEILKYTIEKMPLDESLENNIPNTKPESKLNNNTTNYPKAEIKIK